MGVGGCRGRVVIAAVGLTTIAAEDIAIVCLSQQLKNYNLWGLVMAKWLVVILASSLMIVAED